MSLHEAPLDDDTRRVIGIVRRVMFVVGAGAVVLTLLSVSDGRDRVSRTGGAGLAGGMLLAGAAALGRVTRSRRSSSSSLGAAGSSVAVPGRDDP
ncbi:MAG: hypothetical protein Q8O67_02545 [Deltaproteobacteria bacterium]|nr:hypothetical protein [Deltaproteobacteria bacterium]